MLTGIKSIWNRLFLEERPSIGLSFFRLCVAFTVGAHVIPTLLQLQDNYLHTAFKEKNPSFFNWQTLVLVEKSPDWFVKVMAALFCVALGFFAAGLFSQFSCCLVVLGCYYFYALNSLHIGTLSYDILLVTLSLMCVTGYPGDFFSLDSLLKADPFIPHGIRPRDLLKNTLGEGNPSAYWKKRPFFIQRLLQMQLAFIYFYTGLGKITGDGNWLTGNPIWYLMNSPPQSVVKHFVFREFFAGNPALCYWIGVVIVLFELLMPALLFWRSTRFFAIFYGLFFHVVLLVTLHVPTIFFFLFPPMFFLFIEPEKIIAWIDKRRQRHVIAAREKIIYDGRCHFCIASIRRLEVLDLFGNLEPVDFQEIKDLSTLDPRLTYERCHSELQLLAKNGKIYGGFYAFRRLSLSLPLLWPFVPVLYFPGMQIIGSVVYSWVAKNRYLFHRKKSCINNSCFR